MNTQNQLFAETIAPYSAAAQRFLRQLRTLVLETALEIDDVGVITEALRWGQFSFLTLETGSGSTIRIDGRRSDEDVAIMYFHCQSGLIDHFKDLYADQLKFEGKRAIIFDVHASLPEAASRHCISLALTHHLRKIRGQSRSRKIATPHHHRH